jgi:hypothetical protein
MIDLDNLLVNKESVLVLAKRKWGTFIGSKVVYETYESGSHQINIQFIPAKRDELHEIP